MRIGIFSRIKNSTPFLLMPFFLACGFAGESSSRLPTNEFPEKESKVVRSEKIDGWQKIADVPDKDARYGIQCADERFCWLYDSKKLWRSENGGETWSLTNPIDEKERVGYYFANEQTGWKYSWSGFFKSIDAGRTWGQKATPLDSPDGEVRTVWFLNDGKTGWLGGGIYRPQTKEEERIGVPNNARYGNKVLEEAILRTDDGGETWRRQSLPEEIWGRLLSIKFFDENHGVTMGEHVVYYTDNGGKSWRRPAFKKGCVRAKYLSDYYDASPEYIEMFDSTLGWLGFSDGRIVKSIDGGRTWCDLVHPGEVAFGPAGHEYFTSLHFDTPEHGWGLGWDRFIYETRDGGTNWRRLTSDVSFDSMFFVNRNEGLAVSVEGLFRIKS